MGRVLFAGSSSIGLWPTLEDDFRQLDSFRRSFGGSTYADVLYYAARIILPYRPRAIVLYAGDNDVAAGMTIAAIRADADALLDGIAAELPETRIYILSVKPSPSRMHLWIAMQAVNTALCELAATRPRCRYIDITPVMFDSDGTVRTELFTEDLLHMNADGYRAWTAIITPVLEADEPR
jgi:lysophospholipase L1-like esterase